MCVQVCEWKYICDCVLVCELFFVSSLSQLRFNLTQVDRVNSTETCLLSVIMLL